MITYLDVVLFLSYFSATPEPFNTDKMAEEFTQLFANQAFTEQQSLAFNFEEKRLLSVCVKSIEGRGKSLISFGNIL